MKRLSVALSSLLTLNLLTHGVRAILPLGLPLTNLWVYVLISLGIVALTYFATLDASPLYSLYHREFKVYAACALLGVILGCF